MGYEVLKRLLKHIEEFGWSDFLMASVFVIAVAMSLIAVVVGLCKPEFTTRCIDGITYIKGYNSLTVKLDTDGKIILCGEQK